MKNLLLPHCIFNIIVVISIIYSCHFVTKYLNNTEHIARHGWLDYGG